MLTSVKLYIGSYGSRRGIGGWCFRLEIDDEIVTDGGTEKRTTSKRMELLAAIQGLKRIHDPRIIELITTSKYLLNGITTWLGLWERSCFRTEFGRPVKNRDLWEQLQRLIAQHEITPVPVATGVSHLEVDWCNAEAQRLSSALASAPNSKAEKRGKMSVTEPLKVEQMTIASIAQTTPAKVEDACGGMLIARCIDLPSQ